MTLVWMAIPLTQGLYALVNSDDYERLNKYKWYAHRDHSTFYAVRHAPRQNGKQGSILMHREILGLPKGIDTDHRNGCGLDNRKANLRPAAHNQNQWNQQPHYKGTSQYKGVCWHKRQKKWRVQIRFEGTDIYLGVFTSEIEAAKAYDKKAVELFGDFAKTNF